MGRTILYIVSGTSVSKLSLPLYGNKTVLRNTCATCVILYSNVIANNKIVVAVAQMKE